ncbi:hypothetical protein [Actinocrispum wychmicini]|uniref:Putative HAF family extracellular repeat protein n=1 Tax=Actinocrispum wychmicini TaxID=1213861 RepID=A0A4R2JPB9_9PSEU|nr:hypothetical protein [Actinocrispum wychmicini]TCO62001.1 putative HAF family extracellular repeat protein [Actinocrispum wychmicini]
MRWLTSAYIAVITFALAAPSAHAAVAVEELPPPPGMVAAIVSALNDAGQATGAGWTPPPKWPYPGTLLAVRWDGTTPTVLGTGFGTGINRRGDVVFTIADSQAGPLVTTVSVWANGQAADRTPPLRGAVFIPVRDISDDDVIPLAYHRQGDPDPYYNGRAGSWRNGTFADVPLSPQGTYIYHSTANHRGTTAGSRTPSDGSPPFVFRCSATRCVQLPAAGSGSYAVAALNESDAVAATLRQGTNTQAVVWIADQPTVLPGDTAAVADNVRAINNTNDVVGWRLDGGVHKATLWHGGQAVDLGTSGESEAVAVNDRGDVIGWQTIDGQPHPFDWHNGVLIGLPTPGNLPAKPTALNNTGVVVGSTTGDRDTSRAFRWTIS